MSEVGDNISAKRGKWNFSDVEENLTYISKSVPVYLADMNTYLSDYFISSGSTIYDIGCSTGNLFKKISEYQKEKSDLEFLE